MELKHLQEFVVLAKTCSFQETAANAFVSQAALTKHIQKMESELDVALFDRSTRSVKLNDYGRAFYQYAKQIIELERSAKNTIQNMKSAQDSSLTIAYQPTLGQYGVINSLSKFQQEYPQYSLKMIESNDTLELLDTNTCDMTFTLESEYNHEKYAEIMYQKTKLVVLVPINHPFAKQKYVTIVQLRGEKMIIHENTPQNPSWETTTLMRLCSAAGFEPNVAMTVRFSSNLIRMVGQNMGIGVLSQMLATDSDDKQITSVDLYPEVPFYARLLYPDQPRKKAALDFIDFFHRHQNEKQ